MTAGGAADTAIRESSSCPAMRMWTLPLMPHADDGACRQLATDCRVLADAIWHRQREIEAAVAALLRQWKGVGADALDEPLGVLRHDAKLLGRALQDAADVLDDCAARLKAAHHKHHWSLGRIVGIATVVATTALAVTVTVATMGGAAPEAAAADAAVISAEAAEVAGAAAEATAAIESVTAELAGISRLLASFRALASIRLPDVVVNTGRVMQWADSPLGGATFGGASAATLDLLDEGRIEPVDVLVGAASGTVEGLGGRGSKTRFPTKEEYVEMARNFLFRQFPRNIEPDDYQIKTHYRHGDVLGAPKNYNYKNGKTMQQKIGEFVADPENVRIEGWYHNEPATIYANPITDVVVVLRADERWWTAYKMRHKQMWNLWKRHSLGGG